MCDYRDTVFNEDVSEEADEGKDFVVAVLALLIEGGLLEFTDLTVFGKDGIGEPDDGGPGDVEEESHGWAADHHETVGVVGALGFIARDVTIPEIEGGVSAARGAELECLVGIAGADGHEVAAFGGGFGGAIEDDFFADVLPAGSAGKSVVGFDPIVAVTGVEQGGFDAAHEAAMEKLMVHVHQVFVHEREMTFHEAIKVAGLVSWIAGGSDFRKGGGVEFLRVTWIDKDEAVGFAAGERPHVIGAQAAFLKVGNADAFAGVVVFPAVVGALDAVVLNDSKVERDLAMGTTILKSEYVSGLCAQENDEFASESDRMRFRDFDVATAGEREPKVRIDAGLANIPRCWKHLPVDR